MKIGFVMDPLGAVNIDADTTFALMFGAQERGHEVHFLAPEDLYARGSSGFGTSQVVTLRRERGNHVSFQEPVLQNLNSFDCIWMRKDPPFDEDYLYEVGILELAEEQGTLVVNRPQGLRAANEKLYALHFEEAIPATVVTSKKDVIKEFMAEYDGKCVLKPLNGHGGEGIFVLQSGDRNLNTMIELSTSHQKKLVMCQEYLPAARQGDKRVILLNGEPLGAILRVPLEEEHRSNIHVGGRVEKTSLTEKEREICELVGPRLVKDGLYFVGLDMIGERLTEVNVTSPTGIQEMSRLDGMDGSQAVIAWIEQNL